MFRFVRLGQRRAVCATVTVCSISAPLSSQASEILKNLELSVEPENTQVGPRLEVRHFSFGTSFLHRQSRATPRLADTPQLIRIESPPSEGPRSLWKPSATELLSSNKSSSEFSDFSCLVCGLSIVGMVVGFLTMNSANEEEEGGFEQSNTGQSIFFTSLVVGAVFAIPCAAGQ